MSECMRYPDHDVDNYAIVMGESFACVQGRSDCGRKRLALPLVNAELVPATGELPSDLLQFFPRMCARVRISPEDFDGDGRDADGAEEEKGEVKSIGPLPHPLHCITACGQYLQPVGVIFHLR